MTANDIIVFGDLARKAYFIWKSFEKTKSKQDVEYIVRIIRLATTVLTSA